MTTGTVSVPTAAPSLRRKIFSLAWPVILNNLLLTFVWIADMIMVGRLGSAAVAAVGVSGQMFNMVMALTLAVTTGTIALVARHIGAQEKERADAVLGHSLLLSTVFAAVVTVPTFVGSASLFRLFGADPVVTAVGVPYLRVVVSGTLFLVVALVFAAALRGAGDTKTPLFVSVGANVVNVILNYGLIFGKLGMPELGVLGAGIASIIAFTLEAAAFVYLSLTGKLMLSLPRKLLVMERDLMARILRIGSPSAVEHGLIQLGYLWYMTIITGYGTGPLAAYMIGVNIMSLSFMPGFGFSVAASALVGQSLGAKEPSAAASQGWECTRLAVWVMAAIGIILFVAAKPTALIYVNEAGVVDYTALFVRVLALCQPAMAIHFALSGALIGAADTRWPLYSSFIGMFLIRLPLAFLAAHVLGLSITWVWLIILADHYIKAFVLFLRFLSGRWKSVKV
ncbi:MAG: MATE family efflux transporter [Candidatus Abyssobacteria bacterium SURF_5]|uniref:Multidrug-efflux transporter n=1 Tax=Abyssobacteria bacterium (strain SURF_5) TaxID=2093360 RepID=A0A3A4NUZ3_ABYX5|nr:MAG: MATE family efflux transporter [Candidatus Abyssubacteria bacterium SURF_5]